jgi:hypothetical protein
MENATKPKTLTIDIIQEKVIDKKGKEVKDMKGEIQYKRDDFIGLINLLNRFDTKRHGMDDYKNFLKTKDKILKYWADEITKVELSLNEATFLKNYLTELPKKEGMDKSLAEFEMRTLIGIIEQLE